MAVTFEGLVFDQVCTIPYKSICQLHNIDTSDTLGEWIEWKEAVDMDNDTMYRKVIEQICTTKNCEGDGKIILQWWVLLTEQFCWHEADLKCREIGGRLYTDFENTSTTELELMIDKAGSEAWMGLIDIENTSKSTSRISSCKQGDDIIVAFSCCHFLVQIQNSKQTISLSLSFNFLKNQPFFTPITD